MLSHRDKLISYLNNHNIENLIHYPIPPHKQKAYVELSQNQLPLTEKIHEEVLSLPMGSALTDEQVEYVIQKVNEFKT